MKGSQMMKPNEDAETSLLSLGNWKLSSSGVNNLKEILHERTSSDDASKNYTPTHMGKDVIHVVVLILDDMGSYHWKTSGLFMVARSLGETISRNKGECLKLLEEMAGLVLLLKQIRDRKIDNQNMGTMIKTEMKMIFKGYRLCCFQMDSSKICRFFTASRDTSQLSKPRQQLDSTYHESTIMAVYPKHSVGTENQIKELISLLEHKSTEKAVAVTIHSREGMGQTTLMDAMFSFLDIKDCKYSMVKLFETTSYTPDIIQPQKTIVIDLSKRSVSFSLYQKGQQEIEEILKDSNTVVYIDNI